MPPASGAGDAAPPPSDQPDPVLAAERDHLRRSREFLRLMREDVLGLRAMAGDPVSEEYLKADLYRRAQALRDIPGVALFFGRLDYAGTAVKHAGISRRKPASLRRRATTAWAAGRPSPGGRCRA